MNPFKDYDPADTMVSVRNILVLTLMVVIGVNFLKFATSQIYIPGLTELTQNT